MKRLLKLALVVWLLGEWYTRGGKDVLFGEPGPDVELRTIRDTVRIRPPSLGFTFTDESLRPIRGREIVAPGGDVVGVVLSAERAEDGSAIVSYQADRLLLGYPINVALSEVQMYLSTLLQEAAVRLR